MTYGFKIVEEMIDGPRGLHGREGLSHASRTSAAAPCRNVTDWQHLNLNYVAKARIDQDLCIKCGRCHIACEDTSHQAISAKIDGERHSRSTTPNASAATSASLVCPVENCITLVHKTEGVDPRTGLAYDRPPLAWTAHPNNPGAE